MIFDRYTIWGIAILISNRCAVGFEFQRSYPKVGGIVKRTVIFDRYTIWGMAILISKRCGAGFEFQPSYPNNCVTDGPTPKMAELCNGR